LTSVRRGPSGSRRFHPPEHAKIRAIIRFSDGLHLVVRHAATFCVAAMPVVMLIQVFARYALNAPPT
jgi:hypothetical protein